MKPPHPSPSRPVSLSSFSSPLPFLPASFPLPIVLMSSHADQIDVETVFCSCGQFSLYGPDKSRHCTITSHKSWSVSCCAELMNYWTGGKSAHMGTHTLANIHTDTYLGAHLPHYRMLLCIKTLLRVTWEQADRDGIQFVMCRRQGNIFRCIYFSCICL